MQLLHNFGWAMALTFGLCSNAVSGETVTQRPGVTLELNNADIVGESCRLTFVATNKTETEIERAVYETVLFSKEGQVVLLTLFDFGHLPIQVPRVRQFQIPDTGCAALSSVLINGPNTCSVGGQDSDLCNAGLTTSSRVDIRLQG